jgi:phage-related protein
MAKERDRYHLWQHEVKPPKRSERTVIAKVSADAAATTAMPAAMMSTGGRAAHRAGVTHESSLARLIDNGHVASIQNVFDEATGDVDRAPSTFAAVSSTDRGTRRRSPRLVELKVSKGTSASQLASHVARMKDVEYAFVPPVRQLFARRKKAGAALSGGRMEVEATRRRRILKPK